MGVDSEFKIGRWHLINKIYDLDKKKTRQITFVGQVFQFRFRILGRLHAPFRQ